MVFTILNPKEIKKINWHGNFCIYMKIRQSLSTFDWNDLTELVILCHDQAIRFTVQPCNIRFIALFFHQRRREGGFTERHPTIEEAVQHCRERWNEK